jgi:aspartate-semialdehyde dehydrogenase
MALPPNYCRVAIAGASSLRGRDLTAALEERSFPATDIRLLDDEVVDGTLTEARGEPLVIEGLDDESFDHIRFAFFTGSPEFARRHWTRAARSGATVIDLGGPLRQEPSAVSWIPGLRKVLPPTRPTSGKLFYSPPVAVLVACTLAAALQPLAPQRFALTFLQPVSDRDQAGVDELESQTVNLLSLKPAARGVFDAQVGFNLLGAFGDAAQPSLAQVSADVARDAAQYLAGRVPVPALRVVHAPVFYGCMFAAFVECSPSHDAGELARALETAGVHVATSAAGAPSNVSIAGESVIHMAAVERDASVEGGFWLWGGADNLRLASANAISIAETLLAS